MQEPGKTPEADRTAFRHGEASRAYRRASRLADERSVPKPTDVLERLARQYAGVVDQECRRCRGRLPAHLDVEDMVQEARSAFLAALNRYDPEQDASFGAFAHLRVRGAILDWLRREGGGTAAMRALAQDLGPTHRRLTRSLGRPPDLSEVASALGMLPERLDRVLETAPPLALSPLPPPPGDEDPAVHAERRDLARRVARALAALPDLERTIIDLHYFDELSLRETASVLGEERSRVRRRHQEALLILRTELADLGETRPGAVPPHLALLLGALLTLAPPA